MNIDLTGDQPIGYALTARATTALTTATVIPLQRNTPAVTETVTTAPATDTTIHVGPRLTIVETALPAGTPAGTVTHNGRHVVYTDPAQGQTYSEALLEAALETICRLQRRLAAIARCRTADATTSVTTVVAAADTRTQTGDQR